MNFERLITSWNIVRRTWTAEEAGFVSNSRYEDQGTQYICAKNCVFKYFPRHPRKNLVAWSGTSDGGRQVIRMLRTCVVQRYKVLDSIRTSVRVQVDHIKLNEKVLYHFANYHVKF